MASVNVTGVEQLASLIRAERSGLNATHDLYWASTALDDGRSSELEDAFQDWMYGWATEVSYTTSIALHAAGQLEQLSGALSTLDSQAGSIFQAQFD